MTQADQPTDVEVEDETAAVAVVHCRHCGHAYVGEVPEGGDFLCPDCEHYQDLMQCPTCGSQVRISLMPDEMAPEVHAPRRRKKEK